MDELSGGSNAFPLRHSKKINDMRQEGKSTPDFKRLTLDSTFPNSIGLVGCLIQQDGLSIESTHGGQNASANTTATIGVVPFSTFVPPILVAIVRALFLSRGLVVFVIIMIQDDAVSVG